jgi:hypothetical protein
MPSARIIDFPWAAPRPAKRQAQPARVLILPIVRIERYEAVPREAKLEGDIARELELYAEDRP